DADAYGALFARHADAARMLAARLTSGTPVAADDVVSDAFVGVLAAFRAGKGPEEAFRPYLYTAVRNGAAALRERESRAIAVDDLAAYEKPGEAVDPAVTAFESEVVSRTPPMPAASSTVAGVLGGERDDVAAPPAPPAPAPSSDPLPDTSNDDTPQETPPATEAPEPPKPVPFIQPPPGAGTVVQLPPTKISICDTVSQRRSGSCP